MLKVVAVAVPLMSAGVWAEETESEPVFSARLVQERTVKDGVYTVEQAARGREHYESRCERCHGSDLTGGAGRSLTGDVFMRDWIGLTLDSLFGRMQSMPPGAGESLADDSYVDIISYVLDRNGFPAGAEELSTGLLSGVRVEGEDGPDVVPNYAMVWVVGCLSGSTTDGWLLVDASAEVRTVDPDSSTGAELVEVEAQPLGDQTFELMYVFPSPEEYAGHRVETKGLLIRGQTDSLNVTSVQSLSPSCVRP